jgi:competence protein ComEA
MKRQALTVIVIMLAVAAVGMAAEDKEAVPGVVNINDATAEQLQLLPRIGPALSQRIVDFREANGPFSSPEELVAVKGIGERSLAGMQPYLTVAGETTLRSKVRLSRQGDSETSS